MFFFDTITINSTLLTIGIFDLQDSLVCQSAVHADVLEAGASGHVIFKSVPYNELYIGTVRNRMVSRLKQK